MNIKGVMTMEEKRKVCFLDGDDTAWQTGSIKERMAANVARFGVSQQIFHQTYETTKRDNSGLYDPESHAELMAKEVGSLEITAITHALYQAVNIVTLFPDTLNFCRLIRRDYKLCILTFGKRTFQWWKVWNSGLFGKIDALDRIQKPKAHEIYRTAGKWAPGSLLIDDKTSECVAAAGIEGLVVVHLDRNRGLLPPKRGGGIWECADLNQVLEVVSVGDDI